MMWRVKNIPGAATRAIRSPGLAGNLALLMEENPRQLETRPEVAVEDTPTTQSDLKQLGDIKNSIVV